MTEQEFLKLSDKTFEDLENLLDQKFPDYDYYFEGNVLSITREDDKKVVINRQEGLQEIWLACPQGGFRFHYDDKEELIETRSAEFFKDLLQKALEE